MIYSSIILDKYCNISLHNTNLYIIHNGRTWLTEKQKVSSELLKKHIELKITIGLQPQKEDGTVKWLAIDFDAHNDEPKEELQEDVIRTKQNLKKLDIDSHIEQSGRGHLKNLNGEHLRELATKLMPSIVFFVNIISFVFLALMNFCIVLPEL